MTTHPIKSAISAIFSRYRDDCRGGVALIFGLSLVPLIGITGAAVDYSNATATRARLAQASDAAALAAAKATNLSKADRDKLARKVFDSNLGDVSVEGITFKIVDIASGVRVEATGDVKANFLPVIGIKKQVVDVASEVKRGEGLVEVALVLDNTGSMVKDMVSLKTASGKFIDTLFSNSPDAGSMRVGIVPYVGAVNPGRANLGMSSIDSFAEAPYHAAILKGRQVAWLANCNPDPFPKAGGGGGGGSGGGGGEDEGPGKGGDGAWLPEALKKLGNVGKELFGVREAAALGETPNTKKPYTGSMITEDAPYAPAGTTALVPSGFKYTSRCQLSNPERINHLDLFDRIPGAQWKGCVEARPEPYDVTDDAPNGDPRTKFVPYFWPDEEGKRGEKTWAINNYLDDGAPPSGWDVYKDGYWERTYNIFKYDSVSVADLSSKLGPNKACPEELMRLSTDKAALKAKIDSLQVGEGSGTISSEGVAWGWRVLTPKLPFADGKPYDKAKKFLVLMSDGENEIGGNNVNGPVMSHYSAYGYLRDGRFPKQNFQVAAKYLDERFAKVCENAKAAGVTVMTVYFRDTNANAKNMMKKCATSGQFFYQAVDAKALDSAFQAIASEIGKLRITK
jgi:Flp pilus assembly protein TadG